MMDGCVWGKVHSIVSHCHTKQIIEIAKQSTTIRVGPCFCLSPSKYDTLFFVRNFLRGSWMSWLDKGFLPKISLRGNEIDAPTVVLIKLG